MIRKAVIIVCLVLAYQVVLSPLSMQPVPLPKNFQQTW
jgi:hypothetical protein